LPDRAVDGAETETGAFANFLRGEERLQSMIEHIRGHTRASVGDGDAHILAGWKNIVIGDAPFRCGYF
jgi:hypothetical protein